MKADLKFDRNEISLISYIDQEPMKTERPIHSSCVMIKRQLQNLWAGMKLKMQVEIGGMDRK